MASNAVATDAVLIAREKARTRTYTADALIGHGVRGLWAGAGVLLLGSAIDLAVLWGLQFQSSLQWEFVAIVNTLEAYTRLVLGVALIFAALAVGRTTSLARYRVAGILFLALGIVAAALGFLLLTDYFPLSRMAENQAAARNALTVTAAKGLMLSGVYTIVLVPLGILGLRKPA